MSFTKTLQYGYPSTPFAGPGPLQINDSSTWPPESVRVSLRTSTLPVSTGLDSVSRPGYEIWLVSDLHPRGPYPVLVLPPSVTRTRVVDPYSWNQDSPLDPSCDVIGDVSRRVSRSGCGSELLPRSDEDYFNNKYRHHHHHPCRIRSESPE